jgi:hypothetical protein
MLVRRNIEAVASQHMAPCTHICWPPTPSGSIADTAINSVYLLGMVCVRTLVCWPRTPSGSIADTAINSVYLLGMVCVRTLVCWPRTPSGEMASGATVLGAPERWEALQGRNHFAQTILSYYDLMAPHVHHDC